MADENNVESAAVEAPGTAPEAATGGSAPSQDAPAAEPSVDDILKFDPFGPEGLDKGEEESPKEDKVGDAGDGAEDGQPPKEKPSDSPKSDPEAANMQKAVEEMQKTLEEMKKTREEPKKETKQQVDDIPSYLFDIPDQVVSMLGSEDPGEAKKGAAFLIASAGRSIHQSIRKEIVEKFAPAFQKIMLQQVFGSLQQKDTQNSVRTDFYGKFPQYDKPELRPVVQEAAKALAKEMGVKQYGPEFRDALGERLGLLFASITQTPEVKQPPKVLTKKGARANPVQMDEQTAAMMDMLN